jgi:hypothetical protein
MTVHCAYINTGPALPGTPRARKTLIEELAYEAPTKSRIRSMSRTRSAADPAIGVTFSVVTPEARSTSSRSRT